MKHIDQVIQQQIEAYLRQDMSDLERSGFERRMHEDPALHEEVQHQEALIMAVRNERMLHLKSGLQAIPVSLWTATLLEYGKIAAISLGIGLASAGGYFMYQSNSGESYGEKKNIRFQESNKQDIYTEHPVQAPSVAAGKSTESVTESAPALALPKESENSLAKTNVETARIRQQGIVQEHIPQSSEPDLPEPVLSQSQPRTPQNANLPEDRLNNKTHPASMQPEVIIKRDNREKFHYQFSEGKLVLYADFNEKLYEVLELNQHGQRNLFLSYDGKFYALDPLFSEISPLKEVKDKNLIQILTEYHKRK